MTGVEQGRMEIKRIQGESRKIKRGTTARGQNALCYEITLAQLLWVFVVHLPQKKSLCVCVNVFPHFLGLSTHLTLNPW